MAGRQKTQLGYIAGTNEILDSSTELYQGVNHLRWPRADVQTASEPIGAATNFELT
jgi:hypothetical protein